MKCIKLIAFFGVVSITASSCSLFSSSHTKCAAYTINDDKDDVQEEMDKTIEDCKEGELI